MIAMTIDEAVRATGMTRTRFYEIFKEGGLTPRKSGRRTLILVKELERYMLDLPRGLSNTAVKGPTGGDKGE
jgi:hypothetical protein